MGTGESNGVAWYRSLGGIAVISVDLVLLLALVVGTTKFGGQVVGTITGDTWEAGQTIPWYVYIYGVLGAMGYVLTMLVRDFERGSMELAQHNLRLPAALPLAAGVYLLSERFIGAGSVEMLAALSFGTGLLVNTAYLRIRDLSVRLLSTREDDDEREDGDGRREEADGVWKRGERATREADARAGPDGERANGREGEESGERATGGERGNGAGGGDGASDGSGDVDAGEGTGDDAGSADGNDEASNRSAGG